MDTYQERLIDLPLSLPSHPAKYTEALLPIMATMLQGSKRVLDPFAGVGGIFKLDSFLPNTELFGVEIEPKWCERHPRTTLGNSLHLPWSDDYFDACCTSPGYGNRLADKRRPSTSLWKKGVTTYADMLGEDLHPDNGGGMQWGDKYRDLHQRVWTEARRVLQPGGKFVLNIKDHYRNKQLQPVTDWHISAMQNLGFVLVEHVKVDCPGMRYGRNGQSRVDYESVILFNLPTKEHI